MVDVGKEMKTIFRLNGMLWGIGIGHIIARLLDL